MAVEERTEFADLRINKIAQEIHNDAYAGVPNGPAKRGRFHCVLSDESCDQLPIPEIEPINFRYSKVRCGLAKSRLRLRRWIVIQRRRLFGIYTQFKEFYRLEEDSFSALYCSRVHSEYFLTVFSCKVFHLILILEAFWGQSCCGPYFYELIRSTDSRGQERVLDYDSK